MKTTAFFVLFLCVLPTISRAAGDGPLPVDGYPGWTLELVQPDEESGTYRQPYYALKPPDKRPLASITHQAAEQLQNGEVGPEAVYAGGSSSGPPAAEKKDSASGISGFTPSSSLNNSNLSSVSGSGSTPSLYKAPTTGAPAADPAPAATTAASTAPNANNTSGASSLPNADGGERAPASLAANNAKSSGDFQVGAVGKGAGSTTTAAPTVVHACTSPDDCQRVAGSNYLLGGFDGSGLPNYGPGMGYQGNSLASNAAYICSKVGKSTVVSSSTSGMPFTKASPLSFCTTGQGCTDGWVGRFEIAQGGMSYKVVSAVDCK